MPTILTYLCFYFDLSLSEYNLLNGQTVEECLCIILYLKMYLFVWKVNKTRQGNIAED